MSFDAAGQSGSSPPSRDPAPPSALLIAWFLLAGFFLLVVPVVPSPWDRVAAGETLLRRVAATHAARLGISGFGLVMLMVASWDLATALVSRWTRWTR